MNLINLPNLPAARDAWPTGWYVIAESSEVTATRPLSLKRFAMDLVLWRDAHGLPVIMYDLCPHRSVKLSQGKITDGCIECPFHGMRFASTGKCALVPETGAPADNIKARVFQNREKHGFIWIWFSLHDTAPVGEPEWFSEIPKKSGAHTIKKIVACHVTRAIENQLDHVHLAFVHRNTIGVGFDPKIKMRVEHDENSIRFYRENTNPKEGSLIHFKMPNIWINQIAPKFVIFLAFCPVDDETTLIYLKTHQGFITLPYLGTFISWLLNLSNHIIFNQDSRLVRQHPQGDSLTTGTREFLLAGDRAIRHFRELWTTRTRP